MRLGKKEPDIGQIEWVSLSRSASYLITNRQIFFISFILFILTLGLTWLFYQITMHLLHQLADRYPFSLPDTSTLWGWIKYQGWVFSHWIYIIVTRIISFYFSFLLAYCLISPGYAYLSLSVEKSFSGGFVDNEGDFSVKGICMDLVEGCKIGLLGIAVTFLAFIINFFPVFGQILVFFLYSYYSCLMFIDYPAARRRWTLGRKVKWLRNNSFSAFRLGFFPALISMIPVLNIFFMALLFPLLTIQSTLNFSNLETELFKKYRYHGI
jgi:CysZ protein